MLKTSAIFGSGSKTYDYRSAKKAKASGLFLVKQTQTKLGGFCGDIEVDIKETRGFFVVTVLGGNLAFHEMAVSVFQDAFANVYSNKDAKPEPGQPPTNEETE